MEPWYNSISFEGIAAGYLEANEFEPEFVDAVERASLLDYNPCNYNKKSEPCRSNDRITYANTKNEPFVARLIRIFPVALSFVGSEISMSGAISAASLQEVLTFGELKSDPQNATNARKRHDKANFINERGGRHWIMTNAEPVSDWVPGFWEEEEFADVPSRYSFSVSAGILSNPDDRWTVDRKGDRFFVMTNYEANNVRLTLPVRNLTYSISVRRYDAATYRWTPPEVVEAGGYVENPNNSTVLLPPLRPKELAIISISSSDYAN